MARAKLTPERHALVVRYITAGEPHRVAAERAGLGERTLERYLARGREADESARASLTERQDAGEEFDLNDEPLAPPDPRDVDHWPDGTFEVDPATGTLRWTELAAARGDTDTPYTTALLDQLPDTERPYWRLWRSIKLADAASEAILLGRIQESGRGYTARQTTTTTVTERVVADDGSLKAVKERTTVVTVDKDVRHPWLNVWLLQARLPEHYGRYKVTGDGRMEDTGPDGDDELGSMDDEKAAALDGLDDLEEIRARRREAAEADEQAADG